MIVKVSSLVPIIAGLLDDRNQDFATLEYLLPIMQAAQNDLIVHLLENPNIGEIKSTFEISNVTIGTVSLRAFGSFASGKPLYLLKDVIVLEEKVTGQALSEYAELTRVLRIPAIVPGATNQMYAWTDGDILLPGATSALDFRVFGTFEPQPLVSGDSLIVPGTASIIQYRTAELVAAIRGNGVLSAKYEGKANDAEYSHFTNVIMAQQAIPRRQRPYPRGGVELKTI